MIRHKLLFGIPIASLRNLADLKQGELDEQNKQRIEQAMLKATGVERAHFNNERQHLLIVGYNPAQTNSSKILKLVKQQQINAQLIGGI